MVVNLKLVASDDSDLQQEQKRKVVRKKIYRKGLKEFPLSTLFAYKITPFPHLSSHLYPSVHPLFSFVNYVHFAVQNQVKKLRIFLIS
ncbi:hypothetical protein L1887_03529 [Cichorium endivia]|nr:hypothetical protein L1887_03529 [Cichorium endivia]